ncbi:ribonuclease H-like domain-containing protein [Tanacetum coccineum]
MESQSKTTQTVSALKLRVHKTRDYDLWSIRMEQYLTHTNYALWEVIVNGDAPVVASTSVEGPIPPKTSEQKLARKNELKAKSTLLLANPDEHLLKFHGIKDAKALWEAIKTRSEGLDKTYDRFQKLISQLEIHNEVISQEDANLKLLRSLPLAWNNIALIMRNKSDLDIMSMDDLYNNLKVYEAEIKSQSSSRSNSQNVSFVSSENSSIRVGHEDLEPIDTDDLEEMDFKWQVAMLTMSVKRFLKKTRRIEFQWQRKCGLAPMNQGYRNGDASKRIVPVKTSTNALVVQDGISGLESLEARIIVHYKNEAVYEEDIAFFKYDVKAIDNSITELKNQLAEALREKDYLNLKLEKFETSSMKLTKLINSQISVNNKSGVGFDSQMNENELHDCHLNKGEVFESASDSSVNEIEEENNQVNDRFKKVEGYHAVPPPYTGNYMPSRPDLSFARLDDSVYKTNVSETISSVPRIESTASKSSKDSLDKPKDVRPSAPIIKEWESDSDDDCVIRPSFEQNKPSYTKINFVKSDENTRKSVIEQHTYRQAINFRKRQSPKNKMVGKSVLNNMGRVTCKRDVRPVWNNAQRVNHQKNLTHPHPKRNYVPITVATKSGLVPVNAANQSSPRATTSIGTARHVNTVALKQKVNAASPTKYSYFKSHSPLRRPFNQKSAAKTNNFSKKVYTAKNYQDIDRGFSAFTGSHLIGENSVLFTKTECLVLSPDFKLLDESQVLLKVPRQNNMYSFNLKNIVSSGGLTCLIAKATIDKSKLWHRRLGHINFKTMNKLVRGNLVRGLPSKLFENDLLVLLVRRESNTKPLDETSGITKTFITGIETHINHKVKMIRCDNGTEFKNKDMNQFCGMKGIKREFSMAITPQQNGVAKRKNRTLIEAARTMLADSLLPTTFWVEVVNTACYVSVTILNTLDPLGKFDGKADEGFLVRYFINSKAFRVFNTITRKVEENLHINFLENKRNVVGSGPEWIFDIDLLTKSMNYKPVTAGNQTNGDASIETNVNAGQAG